MRLVVQEEYGTLSLNYTWLPSWIGMNTSLLRKIDEEIGKHVVGKALTEDLLDEAHELVVDAVCNSFPAIEGLRDYLDALKFVVPVE